MAIDNKLLAGIIASALAALVIGGLVGSYFFPTEKDIGNYTDAQYATLEADFAAYKNASVSVNDFNLIKDAKAELETEFEDELIHKAAYAATSKWAEGKYVDELDLDEDDYEDYTFDLDLEKWDFAEYTDDDGDVYVTIDGEIEWDNGDSYGEWDFVVRSQYEEDGDLDEESVEFVVA